MSGAFEQAWHDVQAGGYARKQARFRVDWLLWIGQPMVYDGALCVTRSKEEKEARDKHPRAKLLV
jgi:hypothetical protein